MSILPRLGAVLGIDPSEIQDTLGPHITPENRSLLAGVVDFYTSGDYRSDNFTTIYQNLPDIVLADLIPHQPPSHEGDSPIINMNVVPQQSLSGFHRSGWKTILEKLRQSYHASDTDLIFDGFLEKTFLWCRDTALAVGVIPYSRPWVGFVHHPPVEDDTYSAYDLRHLIEEPLFTQSLENCKALLVLSNYIKDYLQEKLPGIPVFVFDHPVDTEVTMFSPRLYKNDVVQVGGWLRDPYAIYALPVSPWIKKKALKGKLMEAYFSPVGDHIEALLSFPPINQDHAQIHPVHPVCKNKYVWGMLQWLKRNQSSVEVLDLLDDDAYDVLLSSSVVFLHLVTASASNTVNECIVRNTPLVVNRLPALVEVLGEDYPLFYDDFVQASEMISNPKLVMEGHTYLKRLDKTRFTMEAFISSFQDKITNLN